MPRTALRIVRLAVAMLVCAGVVFAATPAIAAAAPLKRFPDSPPAGASMTSVLLAPHSTTGPLPPAGVVRDLPRVPPLTGDVLVPNIWAYLWRHGCGPTAVGMVVGHWDASFWPNLIAGDPWTQGWPGNGGNPGGTDPVNQAVASVNDGSGARHYEDYSLPIDGFSLLMDKSSTGAPRHASDSIADFMRTSFSADGMQYGWSSDAKIDVAFQSLVTSSSRYPSVVPGAGTLTFADWGKATLWNLIVSEINDGHPLVALVDSDASGTTDHFVTVVGYDGVGNYICYDTWDTFFHRYAFEQNAYGQPWGVYSLHTFYPDDGVAPVTTVTGAEAVWCNHPVTLQFSSADNTGGSGLFQLYHRVDGGDWWTSTSREITPAGEHLVEYAAQDRVGNFETTKSLTVGIDLGMPATKTGGTVRVKRGKTATLRVAVRDPAPTCGTASGVVQVKTLKGRVKWNKTLRVKAVGGGYTWWSSRFKASMARGTYRYWVYASDGVGNPQLKAASGKLVIK